MNLITLENIQKSYGEKTLFDQLSIMINKGDKAALVARNGTGKTSLIRILAGQELPDGDTGKYYFNKDIRVAYLSQDTVFNNDHTIIEALLYNDYEWMSGLRSLYQEHHDHPEEVLETLIAKMDEQHSWEVDASMKELLGKFQLPGFEFKVGNLSGGQKKRLALVQLLCGNPELLILDEPTNHLDLEMIEWLEKFLSQSQLTVFMVTHDRYFLNNVCNHIYELDRGVLYKYQGDYEDFLEKKAQRSLQEQTYKEKTSKLLRKELEWIRRMPKARTTKNKARISQFNKLDEEHFGPAEINSIEFSIDMPRLGTKVLELHHIDKSFNDVKIARNFSYKFKHTDRIGIIGPNGSGKSTLINMMTGKIKPDAGKIIIGETVQFGHYEQEGLQLPVDKRIIDYVRSIADYIPLAKGHKLSAEGLLERFLFSRPQQQVYISQLSGGERRRLYLMTVLMSNPNFLILDEPTNDLDIITLNILEEYLLDFRGCILLVSHDRYFMDKIVQHVFVMQPDGSIDDFPGNYSEYRNAEKSRPQDTAIQTTVIKSEKPVSKRPGYKEKREMDQIEKELNKLTLERDEWLGKLNSEQMDGAGFSNINIRLSEIQKLIESKESRWLELVEGME